MNANAKPLLVIGGGIGGMTAAVDAAEIGYKVILVEKEAYLGGRVMRMHRYFPKMCPPTCGFEINTRRIKQNPRITVHTMATVEEITDEAGDLRAKIRIRPKYVTDMHLIADSMTEKLTTERVNDFNYGMDKTKALYMPHDMAYPPGYVLDREALSETDAEKLNEICPPGAIDLEMTEKRIAVDIGAVIIATGWRPYDATKLDYLGFGQCQNVITNVMMERLAAMGGPTAGEIVRPSDGKKAENIAFVQCAGSRDENHLPYCSAVCCMGSLKQVRYIREKNENAKITVFYIDVRTIGREEKFYYDLLEDENVSFIKGKVAKISEEPGSENLVLDVEDTITRENLHKGFDMVVLATGMVPNTPDFKIPFELKYDDYGFTDGVTNFDGVYTVGCAKRPCDVSRTTKDSTAATLKAIQCLNRGE
ncbi:heterodisulfide reductase subunit A [candidate division LCP-89 bacterium B3_LCP]|uniref:Heterodisulfide reductase subunit A n=1 Tax=candidate division LCP-89 bacterium B3_LCP TaxID=2012998 RepID=A0A532UU91_UNCL8|nr:MAG: heterodisulfide reductase subunit A [candidate division LCP-89 bacterium B3_LCP]